MLRTVELERDVLVDRHGDSVTGGFGFIAAMDGDRLVFHGCPLKIDARMTPMSVGFSVEPAMLAPALRPRSQVPAS